MLRSELAHLAGRLDISRGADFIGQQQGIPSASALSAEDAAAAAAAAAAVLSHDSYHTFGRREA